MTFQNISWLPMERIIYLLSVPMEQIIFWKTYFEIIRTKWANIPWNNWWEYDRAVMTEHAWDVSRWL